MFIGILFLFYCKEFSWVGVSRFTMRSGSHRSPRACTGGHRESRPEEKGCFAEKVVMELLVVLRTH